MDLAKSIHRQISREKGDCNPNHAVDMYAILAGTCQDISLLVDLLPSYLFSGSDKEVITWAVAGVSLGGHSGWKLLGEDPRISVGIPIIGCPVIKLGSQQ
ncbi:hypothetical protein CPB83DRAFT_405236 [Crepidotus variabilis]|uniref:Uncharacterized protein n=1 Tax=Crepidotus variabilis TaxID=179855 RepID=A0A9P6EQV5_9AGAR|nr:hypothetical protein CPB83DRAFT_405236 [Crepidotus variabilis]